MLLDKVKETIRRHHLLCREEKILIAFSGGIDSTALLHLLRELQEEWPLTLALGHFNHKLRQNAEKEELFVRNTAEKLKLPLYVSSEDVRAHADKNKLNIEEAGRKLRYDFLKDAAKKNGFSKIATGHNMNDQAETFFMRLFRGSGLSGLSGIYQVVDNLIIRPLLSITREEIMAYLTSIKAEFQVDESNADNRFLRNRIRGEFLPYIQKEFDPHLISRIGKVSALFQEEELVLQELVRKEARKAIQRKEDSIFLDLNILSTFPVGLARRVMRKFITEIKGDLRKISFEDIESLLDLAEGKEYPLTKDFLFRREQNRLFCHQADLETLSYALFWTGKKSLKIKDLDMSFSGKELPGVPEDWTFNNDFGACLDLGKLQFPLTVRSRREGDRYQPFGSPGRKKLKEIMRAKRIPLQERNKRPVFLSAGEIIWIYGLPVGEKFKTGPETKDIFCISLETKSSGFIS
ncbi:MAG: tRNA lysidine(34) synthetase TilS [Candidatus Aminicenantes bacterium]|nr:tRNA lysidine(34) synthetase TilS [Candidatus Aminicenantes bacterium]